MGRGDGAGFSLGSLHVSFFGSWVGWVGSGREAGLPLGSLHTSFLGSWVGGPLGSLHVSFLGCWVGWVGRGQGARRPSCFLFRAPSSHGWPRSRGWAPVKRLLGRMGGPRPTSWAPIIGSWVARLLGRMSGPRPRSCWVPFIFPFWGWAAAKKLGFHWAPFTFLGSCGRMGGPRPRSWALRSCLLFSAKKLGSHWAPFIFPFWAPGSDGWAAAKKLSGLLGRMGGPRPRSWAPVGLPSCFLLSGCWVGWVGRSKEAGLSLDSVHISFLRSWVAWVVRGQEAGLSLGSLHGWVGRGHKTRRPSCFLSGLLGPFALPPRMDGSRSQGWAPMASLRSQGCSHH